MSEKDKVIEIVEIDDNNLKEEVTEKMKSVVDILTKNNINLDEISDYTDLLDSESKEKALIFKFIYAFEQMNISSELIPLKARLLSKMIEKVTIDLENDMIDYEDLSKVFDIITKEENKTMNMVNNLSKEKYVDQMMANILGKRSNKKMKDFSINNSLNNESRHKILATANKLFSIDNDKKPSKLEDIPDTSELKGGDDNENG